MRNVQSSVEGEVRDFLQYRIRPLLRIGRGSDLGKTDYDFVEKELADFFRANDLKAIEAGRQTSNEEWITFRDDGHRMLLETIKTPMYDKTGVLIGVLGIGRDITDRKQAELDTGIGVAEETSKRCSRVSVKRTIPIRDFTVEPVWVLPSRRNWWN